MGNHVNHVIIVTGAASGIGAGVSELLAERGAHVIVADREAALASQQAARIVGAGGKALAIALDVSDPASCAALFDAMASQGLSPGGLVNAAGITIRSAIEDLPMADWRRVIDTNLTGTMTMSQLLIRQLRNQQRPGSIVNVTSVMAHFAAPNLAPYVASKGGVAMLTRQLAVELAPYGIRVNAVSPGYIRTGMTKVAFKVPRFAQAVLGRTPMGRFGSPLDVARVVSFLLSEDAGYVTGQLLAVDGGMTAGDRALASPSAEELAAAQIE